MIVGLTANADSGSVEDRVVRRLVMHAAYLAAESEIATAKAELGVPVGTHWVVRYNDTMRILAGVVTEFRGESVSGCTMSENAKDIASRLVDAEIAKPYIRARVTDALDGIR